ncbi:hypothetical protein H109_01602 [Trichophyton interdigitale MR816]|uniref:Zn(2)-C6 fungal-type domain-containing protein n=1 Tax=Trichophyton interdigitale (strain MR816) TaxID=1215338 RepID=A0A059JG07_TRIIM|nr:hypothetical protein H101_02637 [Trichophyton interdigitale H6]KDB26608.1 hypothetical protein H109_01602 [Trichophyton interdigitale MR816]
MDRTCCKSQGETKILRRTHPIASPATQPKREESEGASDGSFAQNRPGVDCEGKTNGPNQRRRTQVACARCRRRKIKCSGDLGNGEACSNCKSSGTTGCLFLRVNSSPLQTKASYSSWAYKFSNSSSSPGNCGQQQAAYDAHILRANSLSIHSGSAGLPAYSAVQPGLEYGTASEQHALANRTSYYSPNYPFGYGEEGVYHIPLSSYVLPASTGTGVSTVCSTSPPTRNWRLPTTLDPTNAGTYPDHDGSGSLSPSFPFLGRPAQKCTSSETVTLFPVMSSLSSGQDRTLPNPATGRNHTLAAIMEGASSTSPTVCSSISATYKQAYQLAADSDSTRPIASSDTSAALSVNVKLSPSPIDCGFGYIPLSSALQACVTSSPFLVNEAVDASVDVQQGSDEPHINKKMTRIKSSTDTCVSEYVHSTSRSHRPGPTRPPGGMLVSGEVYERPQYTTSAGNMYSVEKVAVSPQLTAGASSCY